MASFSVSCLLLSHVLSINTVSLWKMACDGQGSYLSSLYIAFLCLSQSRHLINAFSFCVDGYILLCQTCLISHIVQGPCGSFSCLKFGQNVGSSFFIFLKSLRTIISNLIPIQSYQQNRQGIWANQSFMNMSYVVCL